MKSQLIQIVRSTDENGEKCVVINGIDSSGVKSMVVIRHDYLSLVADALIKIGEE